MSLFARDLGNAIGGAGLGFGVAMLVEQPIDPAVAGFTVGSAFTIGLVLVLMKGRVEVAQEAGA